ncbi:hypothetical protein AB1K32_07545 [Metabacillus dongyingensis]|uniref:hypothetical protein n=1 Tax=Metabacillus dongyingensis TaxID=2874282 RepID=UPI003B8DC824
MQILIQLHYIINGGKLLQQGDFKVNERNYKLDPDKEATRVAYKWYREVKRAYIYEVELHKVIYNQIDITEKVKALSF